jgi:hypothetical protein
MNLREAHKKKKLDEFMREWDEDLTRDDASGSSARPVATQA